MTKNAVSLRFDGKRFREHTIPLDALSDLPAINKMIVAVASYLLTKKTGRQRVPKGFRKNNYLALTGVGEGSAVAKLTSMHDCVQQLLFESEEEKCINEAFETVIDFVNGNNISPELGDIIAPFFNSIGLSLGPGDNLSFQYGDEKQAILNEETRRRLVSKRPEYADNIEMYGTVSEVDLEANTFKITYREGSKEQRVDVLNSSAEIIGNALEALNALNKHGVQKSFIRGRGQYKNKKLLKIDDVWELQLLDPRDVSSRLDELQNMENGWMEDGSGIAPDKAALLKLADLFDLFYWSDEELPYVYPTPSGDIEMEWRIADMDFILEISLPKFTGKLVSSEDEYVETELDLESESGWDELNEKLRAACKR